MSDSSAVDAWVAAVHDAADEADQISQRIHTFTVHIADIEDKQLAERAHAANRAFWFVGERLGQLRRSLR